jgi:hypothetical protein
MNIILSQLDNFEGRLDYLMKHVDHHHQLKVVRTDVSIQFMATVSCSASFLY